MQYYVSETTSFGSKRKPIELKCSTLKGAKIAAERMRSFYSTILIVGDRLDENGFISNNNILSVKSGRYWRDTGAKK